MSRRDSWKDSELASARILSPRGRRYPSQGKRHKDADDGDDGWLVIEHKKRETLPKWFLEAFEQADINGVMEPNRLSIVNISFHRGRGYKVQRFVCMRIESFVDWFGQEVEEHGEATL